MRTEVAIQNKLEVFEDGLNTFYEVRQQDGHVLAVHAELRKLFVAAKRRGTNIALNPGQRPVCFKVLVSFHQ